MNNSLIDLNTTKTCNYSLTYVQVQENIFKN